MGLTPLQQRESASKSHNLLSKRRVRLRSWFLTTWEIYPILFIASFFRLYRIDTVIYSNDQAILFRLAHDAVAHGLLPATSNQSSIGILHPPAAIYFLMLSAALSANPLWAEVSIALFNIIGVLVAYIFTRRYYGRLAGTIVALLYSTAVGVLEYSRAIWQPNLVPPLVVLFMFALFWGAVERRKGWLFPALLLFGLLCQFHESSFLLGLPLLVAIIFAPRTIRWRDLALAFISLLIIFFPYLLWQISAGFADLGTVFMATKRPAHIDTQALGLYRFFLSPYEQSENNHIDRLPTDAHSVLVHSSLHIFRPFLSLVHATTPLLFLMGVVTAGILVFLPLGRMRQVAGGMNTSQEKSSLRRWWTEFYATPQRRGLALLLIWQVLLPATLLRHTIDLEPHYFLIFLPGQYILIALFITKFVEFVRQYHPNWHGVVRYGTYALVALTIAAQVIGSTTLLLDGSRGNFSDRQTLPIFNDLGSLQHALAEADQVAQQRHLKRVYISTDYSTATSMRYLAEQMRTPTTLFDVWHCLVLPSPDTGPVVFLVQPYRGLVDALLSRYTTATLIDQPTRLSGDPFKLYVVTAKPEPSPTPSSFGNALQLLDPQAQRVTNGASWLVSRWRLLDSEQPHPRTTYTYDLQAQPMSRDAQKQEIQCELTSMWAGDQLFAAFDPPSAKPAPSSIAIKAYSFTTTPVNVSYGPLTLETFNQHNTPSQPLPPSGGKESITLSSP